MQQGEQNKALGIAKGMLEDKLPKEQVSKWTGLSLSQVDKLTEEIS
jgi:hypothetical protein